MKKLVRMLAILGAIINLTVAKAQTPVRERHMPEATLTLRTTAEAHNADYVEADAMLMPKAEAQIGDAQVGYAGTFRKVVDSDGHTSDLQTFVNKLSFVNDDWEVVVGRDVLRSFGGTTTTVGFDNWMSGNGLGRQYTGGFVGHHPSGLKLGLVSSDGEIGPRHLDTLMGTWSHQFDKLGVQVHGSATEDHLEKAGLALEWRPTDRLRLLADGVYTRNGTAAMLAGNFALTDNVTLFAGSGVNAPENDSATTRFVVGAEGNLGHGFKAIGAVEHEESSEPDTRVVVGVKFVGSGKLL